MSPTLIHLPALTLHGHLTLYPNHATATTGIPSQWQHFLATHPNVTPPFYGASPCTSDGQLHYLTGTPAEPGTEPPPGLQLLTLPAGLYATCTVSDPAQLRPTWLSLLHDWLPASGHREAPTPEFERYTALTPSGHPLGPVQLSIPLQQ